VARNGTGALLLALAGLAAAEDGISDRWDKPKRESFDMKSAWPEHVVEALTERYGIPFTLDAAGVERADFVAKDVTFFEALDRFAAIHGLGVAGVTGEAPRRWGPRPLTLVRPDRKLGVVPAVYLGASRLSVQSASVLAVVRCAPGEENATPFHGLERPDTPRLRLTLRWMAEPGFEGAALSSWHVTAAEDDTGQRLRLTEGLEEPVAAGGDFAITFERPSPKAKSVKIEGRARVMLPAERGKIEFLASEVGKTKALGAAEVTLDGIDAETKAVSLTVKGAPCAGVGAAADVDISVGTDDVHWPGRSDVNSVTMLPFDAEGTEIAMGSSMESTTDEEKSTFKIELEAVPARITFEALVRGIERDHPFSLADIPLPE
jgi:hypothetical protein